MEKLGLKYYVWAARLFKMVYFPGTWFNSENKCMSVREIVCIENVFFCSLFYQLWSAYLRLLEIYNLHVWLPATVHLLKEREGGREEREKLLVEMVSAKFLFWKHFLFIKWLSYMTPPSITALLLSLRLHQVNLQLKRQTFCQEGGRHLLTTSLWGELEYSKHLKHQVKKTYTGVPCSPQLAIYIYIYIYISIYRSAQSGSKAHNEMRAYI